MKITFYSKQDIRMFISEQIQHMDTKCYGIEYDELLEKAVNNIIDYAREKYNGIWGIEIEISDEQFWSFIDMI